MINKSYKLKNSVALNKIIKSGRTQRFGFGMLRYLPSNSPLFALAVSKKQLKHATDRNLAKRRMGALINKFGTANPKIQALIYLNREAVSFSWERLNEEWQKCLNNWPRN